MLSHPGRFRFPYMSWGSIVASNGIGGGDRPPLPAWLLVGISAIVGASAALAGFVLVREIRARRVGITKGMMTVEARTARGADSLFLGLDDPRAAVGGSRGDGMHPVAGSFGELVWRHRVFCFVAMVAIASAVVVGVMGLAFTDERTGYDRYVLPTAAVVVCLVASGLRNAPASRVAMLAAALAMVVPAVVGIQEWKASRVSAWRSLEELVSGGVSPLEVDGGFEWTAYYNPTGYPPRYEVRGAQELPWYIREFAPAVRRTYVLDSRRIEGYEVVREIRWRGWFRDGVLYLQVQKNGSTKGSDAAWEPRS